MGALALGVLWVGTALVLLASASSLGRWLRLWRMVRPPRASTGGVGLIAVRVRDGSGPFARHTVIQTGRWAAVGEDEPRAILFHDRAYRSELFGGSVEALDGGRIIEIAAGDAEVWAPGQPQQIDPDLPFEQAFARSKHVRGFPREVRTEIGAGSTSWIWGEMRSEGERWLLRPPKGEGLIVSTVDPRALIAGKLRVGLLVMLAIFAVGVAATALAVWPPAFGGRSIAGAVLCLAFFLTMQPIGTWLRDYLRSPASAIVRGSLVEEVAPAAAKERAALGR
jgi:hypothetical protein